jgi:hypothetical protein
MGLDRSSQESELLHLAISLVCLTSAGSRFVHVVAWRELRLMGFAMLYRVKVLAIDGPGAR